MVFWVSPPGLGKGHLLVAHREVTEKGLCPGKAYGPSQSSQEARESRPWV